MKKDEDVSHVEQKEKETLDEVLDSTYPLLQELRDKCPGTYKHSQAVSAMIENVSTALGLDVTFMKVMAMYHDIGKVNNPKFFTENQLEEDDDPHEKLDPWVSYNIISHHVAAGVNILVNDENFSREMIKIISQHHGTSVIKYFFGKAGEVSEKDYRYKCVKPKCIEAAVLMICDHVEATSRSLFQSGKYNNPTNIVDSVINTLLDDEQLDEVTVKLGDLKRLKKALSKELEGIYSKRIDYDEAIDVKDDDKNENTV